MTLPDFHCGDVEQTCKSYTEKFLPRFEALKASIWNAVLPELNEMRSLDQFIAAYQSNDLLFEKRIQPKIGAESYFGFINSVRNSRGRERLDLVMKEMTEDWNLPKAVRKYLQEQEGQCFTDEEADELFDGYCNKIREANKLPLK